MDSLSPEKLLKQYLGFLSQCMTGNLVQRMSKNLFGSRTITNFEVQIITSQDTDMQKASKMMQIVIKKGRNACSSFLKCLGICDPALYENVTGLPAQISDKDHQHVEEIQSEKVQSAPYVINIHNSSLKNVIIGSNNRQCINCDQHCLLTHNDAIKVDEIAHSQSCDQLIPEQDTISGKSICVEGFNIECVTIGDHNSMTVIEGSESEEDTEPESDVIG